MSAVLSLVDEWLSAWDAQGWHRTATAEDEASAAWLERLAAEAGATVESQSLGVARVEPGPCGLRVGRTDIPGVPLFDAPTECQLTAPLSGRDDAPIGVVEVAPDGPSTEQFQAQRESSGHRALVVVTTGARPGLAVLNAHRFGAPFGPPGLQVSSTWGARLREAMASGDEATLSISARAVPSSSRNVVATVRGRHDAESPLVVLTPRTSWWTSTAERGGGIVCWLAGLHAVARRRPRRDVVFLATTGHELGHLGLRSYLATSTLHGRSPRWLHLGANLGATGGAMTLLSPSARLREALETVAPDLRVDDTGRVPRSEVRQIHLSGAEYASLVGTSSWFHLPEDRLPASVDRSLLRSLAARFAAAVWELAEVP